MLQNYIHKRDQEVNEWVKLDEKDPNVKHLHKDGDKVYREGTGKLMMDII